MSDWDGGWSESVDGGEGATAMYLDASQPLGSPELGEHQPATRPEMSWLKAQRTAEPPAADSQDPLDEAMTPTHSSGDGIIEGRKPTAADATSFLRLEPHELERVSRRALILDLTLQQYLDSGRGRDQIVDELAIWEGISYEDAARAVLHQASGSSSDGSRG